MSERNSSTDNNFAAGILATAMMFSLMVVIAEEVGSWIKDKDDIKDPSIEKVVVNDSVFDDIKSKKDALLLNIKSPNCR